MVTTEMRRMQHVFKKHGKKLHALLMQEEGNGVGKTFTRIRWIKYPDTYYTIKSAEPHPKVS